MNPAYRTTSATLALLLVLAAASLAQGDAAGVFDRGRLVTYEGDVPVATERFEYQLRGDSLVVAAGAERRIRKADGTEKRYNKNMVLVARASDMSMLNYTSNELFDGHTITRSLLPGDTTITTYTEKDFGAGDAELLERPPGRIFALDPGVFSLFDVIGRSLVGRIYGSRPVQLVVFDRTTHTVEATATQAGADTVMWGGKRTVTERLTLQDSTSAFTLWLSPEGRMLRLESADGRLVVMREPPPLPPVRKRPRPKPQPH